MAAQCSKGILLEFDFAAVDGSSLLYAAASGVFESYSLGIAFDKMAEARYFSGKKLVDAVSAHLSRAKSKRGVEKTACMIEAAFDASLAGALASAVNADLKGFLKTLSAAGVKIVVFSRLDPEDVKAAIGPFAPEAEVYLETSVVYGAARRDAWLRMCAKGKLSPKSSVAVSGNAEGVKAALISGIPSAAVHEHVSYQDFGGADAVSGKIDAAFAKKILKILNI